MVAKVLRAAIVGVASGIAVHGAAFAGPPYVTDDAETLPQQAWEINVPYVLLQSADPKTAQAPLFDINYGLSDAVQLKLEVPILYLRPRGDHDVAGLGDTLIGVKWQFQKETDLQPQLTFYPQVQLPTGSKRRGLGAGSSAYILPLIAEKSWAQWTAFSNVAWVVQTAPATRDYAYYGAALLRTATKMVQIGAEVFGNTPTAPGAPSDLGWNAGLEWQIAERVALLASGGHSLQGGAGTTLYLGFQLHLGKWPAE